MKNGIDLHLHLDGSLTPAYVIRQAKTQGIELPAWEESELVKYMTAPADCQDLNEYLEKFDLPCSVMQTEDGLTDAARDVCSQMKEQGLKYVEIRFAPQLHTKKGLTQEQVVKAVLKGLLCDDNFQAKIILCCMRNDNNEQENLETIHIAAKYLGKGVVAADLAGAEALFPTSSFEKIFKEAKMEGIPFTIHAGEAAGPESIWTALKFGAHRIGHGVRCLEDEELVTYLRENQIPLEVCPTSNFQTKAVKGEYPLKKMLEKGLCVTLNTDNTTVSGTTLKKEYEVAGNQLGLTEEEINILKENAEKARF